MRLSTVFFHFLLAIVLISCGKSEKEKAADKIQLAETLYAKGDTSVALQQLDSVKMLYKGAIQSIVAADQFKKKIYADVLYRKQDEMDSLQLKLTDLKSKFVTEKTEFDRYTQYIHKSQEFKRRWNKSFLQIHLDERGDLYLSSNYYGEQWLEHTGIRVYDGDIQAKTEKVPLDNVLNHRSDFLKIKWEKVSYRDGADNGVIEFIAEHADRNLKAVFLGKRYYYIILEEYDKQAVKDALALSKALKFEAKLKKEIDSLQSRIG
ncbi:hypothetical protein ACUNWD_15985 [Sunxiuqinia sp. A32]|uniref:hypothetical protein n=1 Tax=Sunxiuqinia sp. A32 TaxID=3461496 RepID=UPI004045E553